MNALRLSVALLAVFPLAGFAQELASFQAAGTPFPGAQAPQAVAATPVVISAPLATAPPAAAPAQPQQSQAIVLQFKNVVDVVGATITVGDLVAADQALPADLASLPVAIAPAFNTNRVVYRNTLESILLGHPEFSGYSLTGPEACTVARPGRSVSAQELPAIILPEIQRATRGEGDVKIEEVARVQGGLIPTGRIGAQVQLGDGALNHPWGTATVKYYSATGELVGTSTVSYRWSWQRTAWIAARPLSLGEAFNAIDFRETAVDGIKLAGNFVSKLPDSNEIVIGRIVPAGAILTQNVLVAKKIVQRGQSVMVTYNQNNVRISMKGTCLQDGARGEVIPVKNMNSQRTIYAKVVGDQELEIQ